MDASILPHLLSFWTLSFPFIVSAFVHKTQSRDPPLQGNFISQSRLIRILQSLIFRILSCCHHSFQHLLHIAVAIYITILSKKTNCYTFIALFFSTQLAGAWPRSSRSTVIFSTTSANIYSSYWLNPSDSPQILPLRLKRAQDQQEPDITFVYVFPSLALPYQVPLVLLAFGVQLLLWLSCTKPDVLSFSLLLKLH